MTDHRLEFYDPLYETITFQKGLPSTRGGFRLFREDPLDPIDIVQTAEFARLAFLRQAGLAWLVFPSATHTRFGHSIGCWWLGRIAESLIKVKGRVGRDDTTRSLHHWLKETRLREEFYLGLLFHDVGHGPLSHVLERNHEFNEGLYAAGLNKVDHEHRGAELLAGSGPLASLSRGIFEQRYGRDVRTLAEVRKALQKQKRTICLPSILYLITENPEFLNGCSHGHREFVSVLHELVSGLLDLDRLDHYARDSYFSGLRQVSINVRGFLNNLCLTYEGNGEKTHLSLTGDGASYAASLLFGKRQILSTMFRNPRTVSLHTMVNWALSAHLKDIGDPKSRANVCLQIALMEDDQFLEALSSSLHEGCRYVTQRIRSMQPYELVGKWPHSALRASRNQLTSVLERLSSPSHDQRVPSFLFHFDDHFFDFPQEPRDWLDTGCLLLGDTGQFLTEHPDHKENFVHLRDADKTRYLWLFAMDRSAKSPAREQLSDLFVNS
jgi:HD superfamily phosphohydrolase